jgi:hypothetical protein
LDTLHRKVVWALLATHRLVFVGFDLSDPFFSLVLGVFMRDFGQSRQHHFCITPLSHFRRDCEVNESHEELKKLGVSPVYYDMPGEGDHGGFVTLIHELYKGSRQMPPRLVQDRYSANLRQWLPGQQP